MSNRLYFFSIFFTLIFITPVQCIAGAKAMLGIDQMIYLDVVKENCDIEVYVNGIPMERSSLSQSVASIPVHQFLIDGENEIELIINPGSTPSKARTEQRELESTGVQAMAKLVKYPVDVYPGDPSGQVLGTVQWQGQKDKKEIFPKIVATKMDLGPMFGRSRWQDAELITLDKKTLAEITTYVEKFYAAFSASEGQEMLDFAKIRIEEGDRAYPGENSAEENAAYLRDVEKRKQDPHWKVAPLRPALFDFRVCANGRMVEIINSDWKPTIRGIFENRNFEYTYQMFLSKINGKWVMVR